MRQRKQRVLLAFVLSFSLILGGCGKERATFEPEPSEFFKMVRDGEIEDISLTIYYMSLSIWTLIPVDIESIIETCGSEEFIMHGSGGIIVVEGTELAKHTDLLIALSSEVLIPIERDYYINARIYYVFKDKSENTLFEVAMWSYAKGSAGQDRIAIFVNGLYVKEKDIYYDIIIPFIPDERIVSRLEEMKPSSGKRP